MAKKLIFVPMCADFVHVGHINILEGAAAYGEVHVLLMTDQAMESYKRTACMSYKERDASWVHFST
jgi:cytidyltransferase-like protein